jgi:DNA modification methylase
MSVTILQGDSREVIKTLPDNSLHCCVTSPPYFGLRDYGVDGQIGLEDTPDDYVEQLVAVFREVRRVLRPDGTCWLNLGDSYAGSWGSQSKRVTPGEISRNSVTNHPKRPRSMEAYRSIGAKPKDLLGIPWMVAFALRADGWFLRSSIVWHKPNPMPESVTDRPTSSHEMVFLLAKSDRYFYDAHAIAEPFQTDPRENYERRARVTGRGKQGCAAPRCNDRDKSGGFPAPASGMRNARNVWHVPVQPFRGAHFATMPPDLAERCILAGTSEGGCCAQCGAPRTRILVKGEPDVAWQRACGADASGGYTGRSTKGHADAGVQDASDVKRRILAGMAPKTTMGWDTDCECPVGDPVPCTVLDPFGGAGTTAMVADRLGRDAIHIELNPSYVALAEGRISQDAGLFAEVAATDVAPVARAATSEPCMREAAQATALPAELAL